MYKNFKLENEKLQIYSCHIADLTAERVATIVSQWEKDVPIGGLTLFYDHGLDILVINRDLEEKHFRGLLRMAEIVLETGEVSGRLLELSERHKQNLDVLMSCVKARKFKAIRKQLDHCECNISGEIGDFLRKLLHHHGIERPDTFWAVVDAYNYGVIQGKRSERARRAKTA